VVVGIAEAFVGIVGIVFVGITEAFIVVDGIAEAFIIVASRGGCARSTIVDVV